MAAFGASHALLALIAVAGAGALGAFIDGRYAPFTWRAWAAKGGALLLLAALVHRAFRGESSGGPGHGPHTRTT